MSLATGAAPWLLLAALAATSALATALWLRHARSRQLLDMPEDRRMHQLPTPRGGGVAIALALLLASAWLGPTAAAFALGLGVTAGAGLLDDLRPLPALAKLLLQALGAVPLALALPVLPGELGIALGGLLAWALVMVAVNFWNFMDGSNGMAASQALLVGAAAALLAAGEGPTAWLGAATAAACLGFLPFNVPRARVFLGDVGSHALGYAVAGIGLLALSSGVAGPATLLLLPSAFLLDAGLTLAWRLARRQRVWRAHREHLYQRAIAPGGSHMPVLCAYAAWTVAASLLAWATSGEPAGRQLAWLAATLAAGACVYGWSVRRWPLMEASPGMESAR